MEKYLHEYNKYKHIVLDLDCTYVKKSKAGEKIQIISIDQKNEKATLKNLRTKNILTKTLHWCRKNLIKLVEEN
tara:strand:+ start:698 stop:919 length:222 start_codon:yes stop_codon:yes gene_type:complete